MSFTQDQKAGEEIEDQFVARLAAMGIKAGRNSAVNQREMALYDIWDENYQTYEVKFDRRAKETGNVFLEHRAIQHSNAHYVVYKLDTDDNFYILDLPSVKHLLDDEDFQVKDGGYPPYPGTLIPVKDFKKLFVIVNDNLIPQEAPRAKPRKAKTKAVEIGFNLRSVKRR
jgi:hypothetical protein